MPLTKVTYAMIKGEVINVIDYLTQSQIDAVTSATTVGTSVDVTAEIQAAIDAAAALPTGGVVYFPSGVYKTTNTIDVPNKVSLLGETYSQSNNTGTAWNCGPVIYKAHNNDAITVIDNNQSTYITNIAIWSDKTTYTTGDGFVLGPSAGCVLQNCIVRDVGGDSFIIGDNTANSYTNMALDCYSNNPGGRNFVVGGMWFRGERLISDGGTVGLDILDQSGQWTFGEIHFEGFTSRGVRIARGQGNTYGHNILLPYVGNIIGVEFVNISGAQDVVIQGFYVYSPAQVANYNGVQINGSSNVAITIRECSIVGFGGAAVYDGGAVNKILNNDIYGCEVGIVANGNRYTYTDNVISGTTGAYSIDHQSGTIGYWSNNDVDTPFKPTVTSSAGNFSGICVKDNPGYVTRKSGTTSGVIASGTNIPHGLAGNPLSTGTGGFVSGISVSGATPDFYLSSADATNIQFSWTGGNTRQINWTAALPCDF